MSRFLGDEFTAFVTALDEQPVSGLRVNTLKLSAAEFEQIAPFPLGARVPWCEAAFPLTPHPSPDFGRGVEPGKHPYHLAGLYYLQDPSAMSPAELLDPQPGERVLDLAAAPGGKTTHLAALMQGRGLLVANEIKDKRLGHLAVNVERWGAGNVAVTNETPERLADHFGAYFDRVLVDAPCSGEGMFRKDMGARQDWSPEMVAGCAVRQRNILRLAAKLVRPGGYLLYSTCTFAPEEDEAIINGLISGQTVVNGLLNGQTDKNGLRDGQAVINGLSNGQADRNGRLNGRLNGRAVINGLSNGQTDENGRPSGQTDRSGLPGGRPEFKVVELPLFEGFMRGRPDWAGSVAKELDGAVRLFPHRITGEGHFVCLLKRMESADIASDRRVVSRWNADRLASPTREQGRLWQEFAEETLKVDFPVDRLRVRGERLYFTPEEIPDFGNLRLIHPGVWLGTFKKDRFEPAHPLALFLRRGQAHNVLELSTAETAGQSLLQAYLRGESIPGEGRPGWTLVTADGWPLGWGKRVQGVVKNHYPKGWQIYS